VNPENAGNAPAPLNFQYNRLPSNASGSVNADMSPLIEKIDTIPKESTNTEKIIAYPELEPQP
jgi:hypothetical protein